MSHRPLVTAADVLWQTARIYPDRPCVTDLDSECTVSTVTYSQLAERMVRVAGGLSRLGLEPGDRVALLLRNSHAYVEAYLGAIAAGLTVVPLNIRLTSPDYLHMLADSGSRVLVTSNEFLTQHPELVDLSGVSIILGDTDGQEPPGLERLSAERGIPRPISRAGGDAASLMYTSGTTGRPKAVVLSHDSWLSVADTAKAVLDMGAGEVTLHVAPLTHGAGFLFLPTLALGGHNLLCGAFDAGRTLRLFTERGVTGLFLVPSMIRMLLDARNGWSMPSTLKRIYYAGSPIDAETFREATKAFQGRLVQSFAQMESPMFFTVLDQADHQRAARDREAPLARSAGRVLPKVELRIVDDNGATVVAGTPGEILARAPQTMSGYWGRPQDTAQALKDGWLHTGDVGYLDECGYLYIVDRKKDMIVTGGSNVYAREVEEALIRLPGIKEAAVVGMPHRIWGEAVTAVLVPEGDQRDGDAVIAACRASMAGYRVPKQVVWMEALPRNAYGKVLKRQLRELLSSSLGT